MKISPPPVRSLFAHIRKPPPRLWSERLQELDFFDGVRSDTLKRLKQWSSWYCVPGGTTLFHVGEPAEAAYFLLSGGLVVHRLGPDGQQQVLGHIAPGEPIGEMALLSDGVHRTSVTALRDSEVLALDRSNFEQLLEKDAVLSSHLAQIILRRTRRPEDDIRSLPRVFAVVATSPSIDLSGFARALTRKLNLLNVRAVTIAEGELSDEQLTGMAGDGSYDIILLTAEMNEESRLRYVLRQADRVWAVSYTHLTLPTNRGG